MKFKVSYKTPNVPPQEFEADEQGLDGDWLILNKYVKGRGLVAVYRVRHADVYVLEVLQESLGEGDGSGVSDASAIGRVWGLMTAREGVAEEDAAESVPGTAAATSSQEVRRTYRELGVEPGEPVDAKAQKAAAERLSLGGLITDVAAIGRVWGLQQVLIGADLDAAVASLPRPVPVANEEVRRTYESLGVEEGPPNEASKARAARRLGNWPQPD